jgi:hypothetical protein
MSKYIHFESVLSISGLIMLLAPKEW